MDNIVVRHSTQSIMHISDAVKTRDAAVKSVVALHTGSGIWTGLLLQPGMLQEAH